MTSSKSSQKRTSKSFFEGEVSGFDLFYQLVYMSATAAAGISRSRLFSLARRVPSPPAKYFDEVQTLVDSMRLNYPDACRIVGERAKSNQVKTFLLRLADSLRSGEPLAPFLARESGVQGENYENEYERQVESLKKWSDGYTAVMVSVALVVIINMVSTMIYNIGVPTMLGMTIAACITGFVVAYVLSRAAPQEVMNLAWREGSAEQRQAVSLIKIFSPLALIAFLAMSVLNVGWGWTLIVTGLFLLPMGIACYKVDSTTFLKDSEVSSFLRSLGGTATSRGSTLGDALGEMEMDSFPALTPNIQTLARRLRALVKPEICWNRFARETGSRLISQTTGVFFSAINLGGDPEQTGHLSSDFAMRTAMLRAKRRGVAATFTWLTVVMHSVMAALMVFLVEILKKFMELLDAAMSFEGQEEMMQQMGGRVMAFSTPPIELLDTLTIGMVLVLIFVNGFAIIANEGAHLAKISFYAAILMFTSGVSYLIIPSLVQGLM
jgi:flagellar protein FlaJ